MKTPSTFDRILKAVQTEPRRHFSMNDFVALCGTTEHTVRRVLKSMLRSEQVRKHFRCDGGTRYTIGQNPSIVTQYEEYALYRKLRNWALKTGADHATGFEFDLQAEVDLKGHELVRPEVLSLRVEIDSKSLAMEITVSYRTESYETDLHIANNPVVMVKSDGRVIRTHGDFHRLRQWVEQLDMPTTLET